MFRLRLAVVPYLDDMDLDACDLTFTTREV